MNESSDGAWASAKALSTAKQKRCLQRGGVRAKAKNNAGMAAASLAPGNMR